MKSLGYILLVLPFLLVSQAMAQPGFQPPPFAGGVPGMAMMQSIVLQRHQARTLLYQEALAELRKNPAAADVRECSAGEPVAGEVCIRTQKNQAPQLSSQLALPVPSPAQVRQRKVALLFGNNAYLAPIPVLETPIADVQSIGSILRDRFGYELRVLQDAKKADVVSALNRIAAEVTADDSVLIVYAGHGYLIDDTKMGYWIPVDGSTKSPANWISNTDISKFLKNIQAKQVIMISDSCFSGSLTREEKLPASSSRIDRDQVMGKRSVLVMSSGGEEPVSDEGKEGHSIFAWSLIEAIKATSDMTPGVQIFQVVKEKVIKDYPQEPQYGAVLSAGHMEGGEYLFEIIAHQ
jgi:hypothetical protein